MDTTTNGTSMAVNNHMQEAISETIKLTDQVSDALKMCKIGAELKRVKRRSIGRPHRVYLSDDEQWFGYHSLHMWNFIPTRLKSVPVNDLLDVRTGWSTDNFHRASENYRFQMKAPEDVCFSVVLRNRNFLHKSVDLIAETPTIREHWICALEHLIDRQKNEQLQFSEDQWVLKQFSNADRNKNGTLSFDELWKLMRSLNLEISEDYARLLFNDADKTKKTKENDKTIVDGVLDRDEFLQLFRTLTARPDLDTILRLFSSNNQPFLETNDLHKFLTNEQGYDNVGLKMATSIIETFEPEVDGKKAQMLGPIGFRRLLMSRWGTPMKPKHDSVYQDMDRPLAEYFINSSHNTYLTGGQLNGQASVEGYINALKRGARLLEYVFDGPEGVPCLTHKHTLITPITLRDALRAINRYAFISSPYPVILTIEIHVSVPQQAVMASTLKDILGDQLYIRPTGAANRPLPSPNQLKGKFLIRGKRLPDKSEPDAADVDEDNDDDIDDEPTATINDGANWKNKTKTVVLLHPEYSALVSILQAKLTKNIMSDIQQHAMDGSPSITETKVQSYMNDPLLAPQFVVYTSRRLVKSYPKGLRQDSSNLNPIESWIAGVQSAAMNMQTAAEEMDLVNAMFRVNGNCGYVLKPEMLRNGIDPRSSELTATVKLVLNVCIISGQYLPKPDASTGVIDPYVSVEIFGIPCDERKFKTRIIKNNGFNPIWNETFTFHLRSPELAMLRFCVKDYDSTSSNDFIGEYTIAVTSARQGYSHVRLNTGYAHTIDPSAALLIRMATGVIEK